MKQAYKLYTRQKYDFADFKNTWNTYPIASAANNETFVINKHIHFNWKKKNKTEKHNWFSLWFK